MAMAVIEKDALEITDGETARAVLERAEVVIEAAELAKKLVRGFVENGGQVVNSEGRRYGTLMMPGRKSADVKQLEADGLTQYVRLGSPFPQWRWLKK